MSQTEKSLALELQMKRLEMQLDSVAKIFPALKELAKGSQELQEYVTNEITKFALSIRASKLDRDELENFFKHPYHIYKEKHDKENEWHLAIPKFINTQFGWLEKVTESHNIFLINRYVDWLGEMPQVLKQKLGIKDPLDVFLDSGALVGKDIAKVAEKYKQFIKSKEKDRLIIDKRRHFELLATLIKDGILPFIPKPVNKEDMISRKCDFELRDYQREGWDMFVKYSNIGAFFPPSTGKTFLALYAMTHIKPPHLIAVPSLLLKEQWEERIELYTDLQPNEYKVLTYQSAVKQGATTRWKLLIIDEVHHLPSNEFSKLAVLQRDYTIGLSATPQREDSREEYIFALTGRPVGLSWDKLKALGIIQSPPLHVWIVKADTERITRLASLLQEEKKTIIFCDSIEMGTIVSKRFDIPHVHGESKERLEKIKDALTSVVSRVGDEGVSLPDIERVIEISWLHGSRRQELQRFTRLLHGKGTQGEGHIIMTIQEYQTDHKRLFGIMDRGFKIILHREGISEKVINTARSSVSPSRVQIPRAQKEAGLPSVQFETKHPILQLPGVIKLAGKLSGVELKAVDAFYRMPDEVFSSMRIARLLGFANVNNSHIGFIKLVKLGFIKKVNKDYQASPQTLAG